MVYLKKKKNVMTDYMTLINELYDRIIFLDELSV